MITNEHLRELWQRQQPPQAGAHDLFARVTRHRRAVVLRRIVEVMLTVAALGLFAGSIWSGSLSPGRWLLMPFFLVFLIVSWTIVLQQRLGAQTAVSESAAVYAKLRQLQIRDSLRNLVFAERSAIALFIYALVALVGVFLFKDASWRSAGSVLLTWSVLWYLGTRWLVSRKRPALWREYRAMRRIE